MQHPRQRPLDGGVVVLLLRFPIAQRGFLRICIRVHDHVDKSRVERVNRGQQKKNGNDRGEGSWEMAWDVIWQQIGLPPGLRWDEARQPFASILGVSKLRNRPSALLLLLLTRFTLRR